jgi:23S rRNA (uracil1939-C5)-methyltransferase
MRECLITRDDVWAIWQAVLAAADLLPAARELRGAVRVDANGASTFVVEGGEQWPEVARFFDAVPALSSLWWTPAGGSRRQVGTRSAGAGALSPGASFEQVNAEVAASLRAYVAERIDTYKPSHVIDGYAGAGDLAAELSGRGARVTAIEVDRDAARAAAERLAEPSRAVAARVEQVLGAHLPADVVVLNPPRAGVDARVCETLERATPAPRAILYVSCDPATLARDVARLPAWRVNSLVCFDMFPQTAHVESVCELVRAAS